MFVRLQLFVRPMKAVVSDCTSISEVYLMIIIIINW